MKINTFIVILSIVLSSCFINQRSESNLQESKCENYLTTLNILKDLNKKCGFEKGNLGYIEFPINLIEDSLFVNILQNSKHYKNSLIKVLEDPNQSVYIKYIALYGLQHLCVNDYIEVLDCIFVQYRDGKLDEHFMLSSITQDEFSDELIKNYQNSKVKLVLNNINSIQKSFNRDTSYITNILSGKVWHEIEIFYHEQNQPTEWTCDKS